jgi:release factor glutamine methyltransferase
MMQVKSWTIKELLSVSIDYLKEKHIDSPRLTAEVLLAFQLNLNRVKLYLNLDLPLNDSEVSGYRELIRRRLLREPLQYITGVQEFWSLDFQVDPRVLIPRPETELLVEEAKERIKDAPGTGGDPFRILDLGTGSGALAVTLAKEIQGARIWATDISPEAIELARLNAEMHNTSDRIEFRQGDLWHALNDPNITFDLIVSNPPYVSADEYDDLQPEVRDHEPRLALDGREQGLYYIQKIIEGCTNFLKPGGWLLLEMAPGNT